MKVKMLETFQGRDVSAVHGFDNIRVSILERGEEYLVDDRLGTWLIENYKAKQVYKPSQPEPEISEISEPIAEQSEPTGKKRGRK